MTRPTRVTLYEVGPRDGLQSEAVTVPVPVKIELINRLSAAGLTHIEAASFVSPKWVPQMADAEAVMAGIMRDARVSYSALTPNLIGYARAMSSGVDRVAVFASASESFSLKNINATIADSLTRFAPVMIAAEKDQVPVRAYVSCAFVCPYEGRIAPEAVLNVAQKLIDMGCYEVALSDTIGAATPADMARLLDQVLPHIPANRLAVHVHDTYGQALANILTALDYGIATFDSSVGGLGGCPYAPGASGNVATEDVLYMLNGMGVETGVDLDAIIETAWFISEALGHAPRSKLAMAKAR
ncbi:hydroxymethylglutaryl-CoA lyase [Asticcacaulis sp. ZE23SCel15]|uniref:hydroxymethylglutaryl-CoA lyase n=1 Tax=Asticcacaulis sp. ZE23SCel15 TaxID=3059027 RepID=UPI00265E96AF|nr:hydroxymethylglutaryl-CoA lyase [Asticcacaulis sp. ZE23SCel15]WKL58361.1 hydroxymethylglutaryl-CoA lyase [Asticcacaulis sp. ZE23SCel15]